MRLDGERIGPNGVQTAGVEFPRVEGHPTVKHLIYQAIRERIVCGDLRPGTRLVEAELAERFGVSKTPVREALLTLEAEGLVTLRAHRGAEVSRLSPEEFRDLQLTRDALEFGAISDILAAITEADLARAAEHLADMEAAQAAADYTRYRAAQRRLHEIFLTVPGCPSIAQIGLNLSDRMERYGYALIGDRPEWWRAELEVSRRRVELLRRGDADGLIRMLKDWHRRVIDDMTQRFAASPTAPDPTDPPAGEEGALAAGG